MLETRKTNICSQHCAKTSLHPDGVDVFRGVKQRNSVTFSVSTVGNEVNELETVFISYHNSSRIDRQGARWRNRQTEIRFSNAQQLTAEFAIQLQIIQSAELRVSNNSKSRQLSNVSIASSTHNRQTHQRIKITFHGKPTCSNNKIYAEKSFASFVFSVRENAQKIKASCGIGLQKDQYCSGLGTKRHRIGGMT